MMTDVAVSKLYSMNKGLVKLRYSSEKPNIFHSECKEQPNVTNSVEYTHDRVYGLQVDGNQEEKSSPPKRKHVLYKPIPFQRLKTPTMSWDKIKAGCQFMNELDEKLVCVQNPLDTMKQHIVYMCIYV